MTDQPNRGGDVVRLVEDGWVQRDDLGDGLALLEYADGTARFEHVCDRGDRGVIVCAPLLQIGNGHTITRNAGSVTVRASVLCDDCGTHGFITDRRWEPC